VNIKIDFGLLLLIIAVVKGFCALHDNIYEFVCCYNRCHGMVFIGCKGILSFV
jgi:hypothetical protein